MTPYFGTITTTKRLIEILHPNWMHAVYLVQPKTEEIEQLILETN